MITTKIKRILRNIFLRAAPARYKTDKRTGTKIFKSAIVERKELIKFGQNVVIDEYVIIRTYGSQIVIGSKTHINPFTVVYSGADIFIGENVMIAPHCMIVSGNHDHEQIDVPMLFAGAITKGPLQIEDNVWIGAHSVITDGVRIGRDAVVGAGSVVTKDVAPYDIVAGVPAKVIGNRLERAQKVLKHI